jgi:hypothetical protein
VLSPSRAGEPLSLQRAKLVAARKGAASAVLDDAVLDVGNAGRLDRADLLDLEVADVLEQPLAVPEQDRDEVQLERVDQPGGQVLLDQVGASCEQPSGPPAISGRREAEESVI